MNLTKPSLSIASSICVDYLSVEYIAALDGMEHMGSMLIIAVITTSLIFNVLANKNFLPIVLVHGGAGDISDAGIAAKLKGVKLAARIGYNALHASGGNVLDAVEQAVRSMETDGQFNAGYGSVLTWDGEVEADASIMNGADLNGGCASIVQNILHPITVARRVMEKSRHTYLAGKGVMQFAIEEGFDILPEGALVTEAAKTALENHKNSLGSVQRVQEFGEPGTVGAVAIDFQGNLAAATSTGGLTGKYPGRIGDSPILGAGTYADNSRGAVSATGHGETIMRYNLASRIMHLIEMEGMSAQEASKTALEAMTQRFNETAGVISINADGQVGIYFTSKRMAWAYQQGDVLHFGIDRDEDQFEIIGDPRT